MSSGAWLQLADYSSVLKLGNSSCITYQHSTYQY